MLIALMIAASLSTPMPSPSATPTLTPIHVPKNCWQVAKTAFDMHECADNDARLADTEMDRLYRLLLKDAPSATDRENLEAAQTAWLAYRKADILAKHPHDEEPVSGNTAAMCQDSEYASLTAIRIKELKQMLWVKEGDACHFPWAGFSAMSEPSTDPKTSE